MMSQHAIEILENNSAVAESDVRLVRVDKIASSTVNLGLTHELEITTRCEARAGSVVIVRTLTDNATSCCASPVDGDFDPGFN